MKKRIIAVNSNCYHGYSIEEAAAGISAAGFKYIELTATKGWTEHVFPNQSFKRALEVQDLLEEKGLKLVVVPSAELSRGRGGPRCMSMPIWRED